MNKKYKLTKETKEYYGITFYRIEALKDFCDVKRGDKGGWIKEENNLSQDDNCWVFGNAQVSGDARVYGDAQVCKQKLISGYFYYTKQKSEKIESVDTYDEGYETLCREPKLDEEEKPQGKKVKIRLSDNQVVEGEIVEE